MSERFTAQRVSRSSRATYALGVRLGNLLAPGDIVALVGELGAGKTQLVRGACAGAEVPTREVSSPSFAIVATYRGRIPVHHADLYRISDEDELHGTGFADLVGGEGALLVEWADRLPGALPDEKLTLRLAHDRSAPDLRHLEIEGVGSRHATLARALSRSRALVRRSAEPKAKGRVRRLDRARRGRGRGRGRGGRTIRRTRGR